MDEIVGRVHSTESFSTLDGPGIRYVVFMQGCPLRCIYCQNPDTWRYEDGKSMRIDELMQDVRKEHVFLTKNNGGVTASGGEPLAQAEFVASFFLRVKSELGITTAVDTSGCVPLSDEVQAALEQTDYVLVDVKHTDAAKHVVLTGRAPGLIRNFIEYIQTRPHIKIWIRHVIVPGYTTDEKDVEDIAQYISVIKQVERVELLPYHDMGEYKWELLHRDYKLKNVIKPTKEMVDHIAEKMKEYGVHATYVT